MEVSSILNQLEAMANDHVLSSEDNMSDADSETLEAAEDEARMKPINRHHVEVFDKLTDGMRKRRYISAWPGEDLLPVVSDDQFTELFRGHIKRKRMRRKFRMNPDYEPPDEQSKKEQKLSNGSIDNDKPVKKLKESHLKRMLSDYDSQSSPDYTKRRGGTTANKKEKPTTLDQLNSRRKKLYAAILKKEIGKGQKARNFNQKERLANRKKIAVQCMRAVRQKAMLSQRFTKETLSRAKRLTREMQNHWKKFDRVERQQKRLLEKEAEEQQKQDFQLLEAKRQQRKLNFLITQTELYAHFMANKVSGESSKASNILGQLDEKQPLPLNTLVDEYNVEDVKAKALENASRALAVHDCDTKNYDIETMSANENGIQGTETDRPQPTIFRGTLKQYQLKGMNWLLNLYDQGINGILADEMGLGKTVQALAMLSHIAEHYNIWGPFLVITPASTLHNWQQEVAKFLPAFKVVPYWGSPQERKILRQFWDQSNLHKKSSIFHVVITSYQLVITDFKFFNRIKWQYLVLDEAQAIKSSSSQRWKMLLEFKCRNRLLLSGTPIQNTMAELWSLLHFVMPTLFDSHEEFDDWFSKDIESSAESKSQVDEKQISRLHMILKPFMLRRIKKDVENELTEKLEILKYCPLTIRQKHLYNGLKRKIRIEDLLQGYGSGSAVASSANNAITSSLMNLVMQFRKVCNHPELFERRDTKSPFVMKSLPYLMPRLLYQDHFTPNRTLSKATFHHPANVHEYLEVPDDPYGFLKIAQISPSQFNNSFLTFQARIQYWFEHHQNLQKRQYLKCFHANTDRLQMDDSRGESVPDIFKIVSRQEPTYGLNEVKIKVMKETLAHRVIRSKKIESGLAKEIQHVDKPVESRQEFCEYPKFLIGAACPKVHCNFKEAYAYDTEWPWRSKDHLSWLPAARSYCSEPLPSVQGWSNIHMPDKETLVSDAGKLSVLDELLTVLKAEGHRVLIYSQMTKMIDLLEEYMHHRKHTYIRLDGSSKIHERRDMVNDFQQRSDIFIFLLSTRAGGLGINLTAADTVIFYDSDWNPTVDQQAMDRAHRLGQTKQVTVYRLICKGTIEEKILQRAREKSEIQRMVIQGGSFKGFTKPGELKPKEVVSLLLDCEEMEKKYKVQNEVSKAMSPNLDIESSNDVDVEASMEGWMSGGEPCEDLIFDMDNSSNGTSLNTTRAPSPSVIAPLSSEISSPSTSASLVSGRSKRSVKRPPKRFDD